MRTGHESGVRHARSAEAKGGMGEKGAGAKGVRARREVRARRWGAGAKKGTATEVAAPRIRPAGVTADAGPAGQRW